MVQVNYTTKRGMIKDLLRSDLTFYSEYSAEYSQRKYIKK